MCQNSYVNVLMFYNVIPRVLYTFKSKSLCFFFDIEKFLLVVVDFQIIEKNLREKRAKIEKIAKQVENGLLVFLNSKSTKI